MRSTTLVGIDIGTWAAKVVVAVRSVGGELEILGSGLAPSSGLRRGVIVDLAETEQSVRSALDEAQRLSGVEVESVRAVVGGVETKSKPSHAMVAVSRADSEISPEDVARVLKEASLHVASPNRSTLSVVPRGYIVDGSRGVQDPVGMSGMRLEVESLVIDTSAAFLKNLRRVLEDSDLEVESFWPSELTALSVIERKRRELGVLSLDLGGATTTLAVFEEGEIAWSEVLPVGAMHITNDLAIGLKTAVEVAEEVKCEYGSASARGMGRDERVDLAKFGDRSSGAVSRRLIAEIIEARLAEIFSMVTRSLKSINKVRLLPGGVVILGGGAKLLGIGEAAKRALKLPVTLGFPRGLQGIVDRVEDPIFANALGAILLSLPREKERSAVRQSKGDWAQPLRALWRTFSP